MPKAVTATEAKNRLGSLIDWAVEHRDEVIVERQGKPRAVILSFAEYENLQVLKERQRRQEILEQMRRLRERVRARNQDLTDEQAMELADRFVRDVIDDMVAEGKLRFTE